MNAQMRERISRWKEITTRNGVIGCTRTNVEARKEKSGVTENKLSQ